MPRRIDIELTSSRDDGSWTWRAAGAKEPRGHRRRRRCCRRRAKVGDVLRVDAEFFVDGIEITGVVPPKGPRPEPERLELLLPAEEEPLVTTTRHHARRASDRGPRRDGPRRDGPPRRDGDAAPRGRRSARPGSQGPLRARRPPRAQATVRRGAPAPSRRPCPRSSAPRPSGCGPARPTAPPCSSRCPRSSGRSPSRWCSAGCPAVRQAIEKQNAERTAAGEHADRGRSAAGAGREAGAEGAHRRVARSRRGRPARPRGDRPPRPALGRVRRRCRGQGRRDPRAGAGAPRGPGHPRRRRAPGVAGRAHRHRRGRPHRPRPPAQLAPAQGRRPAPAELATQLTEGAGAALTEDAAAERWVAVLDALAFSPVRDKVIPASLPKELHHDVRATIARLATRIPKIAHIFEIAPDRNAPRPKIERRRPRSPSKPPKPKADKPKRDAKPTGRADARGRGRPPRAEPPPRRGRDRRRAEAPATPHRVRHRRSRSGVRGPPAADRRPRGRLRRRRSRGRAASRRRAPSRSPRRPPTATAEAAGRLRRPGACRASRRRAPPSRARSRATSSREAAAGRRARRTDRGTRRSRGPRPSGRRTTRRRTSRGAARRGRAARPRRPHRTGHWRCPARSCMSSHRPRRRASGGYRDVANVPAMSVDYEQRGPFAVIKINRPEARNAVNGAVANGIEEAIDQIEADDSIWVGIITGEPPVFCAGADLKEINAGNAGGLATAKGGFAGIVQRERTKPIIAAVDGPALAGGTEIVLAVRPGRGLHHGHLRHPRGEAVARRRGRRPVPPRPQDPAQHRHGAHAHGRSDRRRPGPTTSGWSTASSSPGRRSTPPSRWPSRSAPTRRWPCASPARSSSRPPTRPTTSAGRCRWRAWPSPCAPRTSPRASPPSSRSARRCGRAADRRQVKVGDDARRRGGARPGRPPRCSSATSGRSTHAHLGGVVAGHGLDRRRPGSPRSRTRCCGGRPRCARPSRAAGRTRPRGRSPPGARGRRPPSSVSPCSTRPPGTLQQPLARGPARAGRGAAGRGRPPPRRRATTGRHDSDRCTTMARATSPNDSKKFLVWRSPGRARLSTPKQPCSRHQSTSASIITSPMPSSRRPGSV